VAHPCVDRVEEYLLAEQHVRRENLAVDGADIRERGRGRMIDRSDRHAQIVSDHFARQERVDHQLAVRQEHEAVGRAANLLDAAHVEARISVGDA
jgi:hypothetical protein